jgi:ABC-type branched-subunit amino acid transport system substrate-binding protein
MKKEKVGVAVLFALMVGLCLLLGPVVAPATAAQKELLIGGTFGLSGPGSEGFARIYDGVKAGVAWINDKGGISIKGEKHSIELVAEDAKVSPDGMIAAGTKLVFDHKVKFMIQGVTIPPRGQSTN